MDVRCDKCQTLYEFDDARVKEAGVTVKCTQCGHIFRVLRRAANRAQPRTLPGMAPVGEGAETSNAGGGASFPPPSATPAPGADAQRWQLRNGTTGEVRRFRDLTTLQQWIVEKRAFRADEISRNGERWKRIGGIPELEPFFRVVEQAERAADMGADVARRGPEPRSEPPAAPTTSGQGPPRRTTAGNRAVAASAPSISSGTLRGVATSDPFLDQIPRRRPTGAAVVAGAAVVLVAGVGGYVGLAKRATVAALAAGERAGRDEQAYRAGRERFLLDTDEDFEVAAKQLEAARAADPTSARAASALLEVNVTWARWLREDARLVEASQPARAEELRRSAQAHVEEARREATAARTLAPADPDVNRAVADFQVLDGAPAAQIEESLGRAEARRPEDAELRFVRGALALRDGHADEARAVLEAANRESLRATQHELLRADYLLALIAAEGGRGDDARAAAQRILATNPRHQRAAALVAAAASPTLLAAYRGAPPSTTAALDGGPATPNGVAHVPVAAPGAPVGAATVAVVAPGATTAATPTPGVATAPTATGAVAQAPANGANTPNTPNAAPPHADGAAAPIAKAEPRGYDSLVATADRLMERGRGKEALKLYEKALAERPDGVEAMNGLAYAWLDTEHWNAASDQFKKVLAIVPNNGDALIGLGETCKLRGDRARAIEYYQKYLAELPGGSKADMARQNIDDLKAPARHTSESASGAASATEIHDAPPLPLPPPPP